MSIKKPVRAWFSLVRMIISHCERHLGSREIHPDSRGVRKVRLYESRSTPSRSKLTLSSLLRGLKRRAGPSAAGVRRLYESLVTVLRRGDLLGFKINGAGFAILASRIFAALTSLRRSRPAFVNGEDREKGREY